MLPASLNLLLLFYPYVYIRQTAFNLFFKFHLSAFNKTIFPKWPCSFHNPFLLLDWPSSAISSWLYIFFYWLVDTHSKSLMWAPCPWLNHHYGCFLVCNPLRVAMDSPSLVIRPLGPIGALVRLHELHIWVSIKASFKIFLFYHFIYPHFQSAPALNQIISQLVVSLHAWSSIKLLWDLENYVVIHMVN